MAESFIDVWHGDILSEGIDQQNYYELLNDDEKLKVASFTRPEIQKKFIKTRGVLRKVLAKYLDTKPQEIKIKIGEHGKPYVENETLFFNLSHTANRLVIAISNSSEIGIDLEQYKHRKNLQGLVKKCFSEEEKHFWESLSEQQQVMLFYQLWVRKEAFVKAIGRGIAVGLDQCSINPEQQTEFLSIPAEYGTANDWQIIDVQLKKEDACALVVKNMNFNYKLIELE